MVRKPIHYNNHLFIIKDIFEKPTSGTMALMGSIKMKPEIYKKLLLELESIVSSDMEMEFRIATYAPGSSKIYVKPTFLSRMLVQGFFNEYGFIRLEQLYDIFRLVILIEGIVQKKKLSIRVKEFMVARSFFGTLSSIYKLQVKRLYDF